jgi:hypothetical protein
VAPFNRNHSGSSCAKEIRKADFTGAKTEKLAENNKLAGTDAAPLAALKVTFGFKCLVFALFEGGNALWCRVRGALPLLPGNYRSNRGR